MGGFFSASSESTSEALQQTLSTQGDESPSLGFGKNVKNSSVLLGDGSVYEKGSTVNYTDGGAIAALKDIATKVINGATGQSQQLFDQVGQATYANNALLSSALASQDDLAKNAATGGQSEQNKVILTVVGIAAALIALVLFFRK